MISSRTVLHEAIRRLHQVWRRWDLFNRDGVPMAEAEAALLRDMKADLLARIGLSRIRNKAAWYERVEAACAPPPVKVASSVPACVRDFEQPHDCPTWRGLDSNEPERRIVGLFWCRRVGRWAIRIQCRRIHGQRAEYLNTETHGMSWGHLAVAIDHLKCVLILRGHLSLPVFGTRTSAWNAWSFAKEKMDCGDVELDLDNPLHAHLAQWLSRQEKLTEDRIKYPDATLRDYPKETAAEARYINDAFGSNVAS